MSDIELNFVPLKQQERAETIYRRHVADGSVTKDGGDFRAKLPVNEGDEEWGLFDISFIDKQGYEEFRFGYAQNPVLAVQLIYRELLIILGSNSSDISYYTPKRGVFQKEVFVTTAEFDEGNSEVVIKPYYLKERSLLGFLLEHRFSLGVNQDFNRAVQIKSYSLDTSGKPNVFIYRDKRREIIMFLSKILSPLLSSSNLDVNASFSKMNAEKLGVKSYIVGGGRAASSQFMGIKKYGPYRNVKQSSRYLFVFSEETRALARDVYIGLTGKLFPGQFSGLNDMFSLPIHKGVVDHHLVGEFNENSMLDIEEKLSKIKDLHPTGSSSASLARRSCWTCWTSLKSRESSWRRGRLIWLRLIPC